MQDRPGHDARYAIDPSRIRNELGWRPSVTVEQGLEKTVLWYLDREDCGSLSRIAKVLVSDWEKGHDPCFWEDGQAATELQAFWDIKALGRDQADLVNTKECSEAIKFYKPRAVINAAAYTSVDKAESEEDLANTINETHLPLWRWYVLS